MSAATLVRDRHTIGTYEAQTGAPSADIVTAEGGGFYPTLFFVGGGAVTAGHTERRGRRA